MLPPVRSAIAVFGCALAAACGGAEGGELYEGDGPSTGGSARGDAGAGGGDFIRPGEGSGGGTSGGGPTAGGTSAAGTGEGEAGAASAEPMDAGEPGMGCIAGRYAGVLEGTYTGSFSNPPTPIPFSVPFELVLRPGGAADRFEVEGMAEGMMLLNVVPFSSRVTAVLDCAARELRDGRIDGTVGFPPTQGGTFTGPVTGGYDAAASAMSGTWEGREAVELFGGSGTWGVLLQPD